MRKMKSFDGREIRGLRVKAYPSPEQQAAILDLQRRLRRLWNWLVSQAEQTRSANEAWAARNGAGPAPARPADDAGECAWASHKAARAEWRAKVRGILTPLKKDPAFTYRSVRDLCDHFGVRHDYQLFPHLFDDETPPPSAVQQCLFKVYDRALKATTRGCSPPQWKRRDQDVLIQTASGVCFRRGAFGPRPGMPNGRADWLDAAIKIPGVDWIPCRLGVDRNIEDPVYWVEGVSLVLEADGWYAAIRQHTPAKVAPAGRGCCGIDVGLVNMFAAVGDDDESLLASNPRKGESMRRRHTPHGYIELIAARQAAELPVSKLQARAARNVREIVRRELFPFTDRYEFVIVEDLPSDIGFRNTPHLSFMRTIRAMLIQRYGRERVIDVDPAGTSRTCSMCGETQPRSWSAIPGRVGKCPRCGHEEDSDLNAARNILRKFAESLPAE